MVRVTRFLAHFFCPGNAYPAGIAEHARLAAFAVLAKNGMSAHAYLAAADIDDAELANALRLLSKYGYLITHDSSGALVGRVITVSADSKVRAEQRRAQLHLVKND
jgi:hypothetical protein